MTVFVDKIFEYPLSYVKKEARKFGKKWCHMITDGKLKELHDMAERIGLRKAFFQSSKHGSSSPHYDLIPSKRTLAIRYGAIEISERKLVSIIKENREKNGG